MENTENQNSRAMLLDQKGCPIEVVDIVEDFGKCVVISRYDHILEEWREERVNSLYIRRVES